MQTTPHSQTVPPRFRPSFESLLAQQVQRRREAGLADLSDIGLTPAAHETAQRDQHARAVKAFVAQQQQVSAVYESAFEEGAEYGRKSSSATTALWVVTGALLGGSLTYWLLHLGGLVAAGA